MRPIDAAPRILSSTRRRVIEIRGVRGAYRPAVYHKRPTFYPARQKSVAASPHARAPGASACITARRAVATVAHINFLGAVWPGAPLSSLRKLGFTGEICLKSWTRTRVRSYIGSTYISARTANSRKKNRKRTRTYMSGGYDSRLAGGALSFSVRCDG